jgi:hypothetical protein
MDEYQQGLHALLNDNDWQVFADREGRERRFVKRGGWRKVATWFGLDLLVDDERMRLSHDTDGNPLRAIVVARAVAPNGRMAEDVGACSISERRFSKPEHDLIATATTRALNRATSNLVGMGELSAEELGDELGETIVGVALPEWALAADVPSEATMHDKLEALIGADRSRALIRAIHDRYGYVPNVTTGLVNALFSMLEPELTTLRAKLAPTEGE